MATTLFSATCKKIMYLVFCTLTYYFAHLNKLINIRITIKIKITDYRQQRR